MVLQSWIINCLKISDEDINFIGKTMKTWKVELIAGDRSLVDVKVHWGIFQRDALSPLLFIMPPNHILRKCMPGYKLSKSEEKINHPICMDNIKLFVKQVELKKKLRKNISGEPESYSRQNYLAETLSKKQIAELYPSFDIRDPFWSGSEKNFTKWTKEQED